MSNENKRVPIGRVIVALRICANIDDIIDSPMEVIEIDIDGDGSFREPVFGDFLRALRSPFRPDHRELIKLAVKDINDKQEDYYPSKETFELAYIIFQRFMVDDLKTRSI